MKASMICNQLGKLERLKLISKGKLSRCLADPLNKEKASAFEDAQEEWYKQFKQGNYENYHVREINGILTPVSNPDKSRNNNLG